MAKQARHILNFLECIIEMVIIKYKCCIGGKNESRSSKQIRSTLILMEFILKNGSYIKILN
jgi:hypothetical protein